MRAGHAWSCSSASPGRGGRRGGWARRGRGGPGEGWREAVKGGRLTLLPVERAIAGGGTRYTPREVAEMVGLDLETLQRTSAAFGVPSPAPDARSVTEVDLEARSEERRV